MEPKVLIFDKEYINKNILRRCKEPISIYKLDI